MKVQCDGCESAEAVVVCCADEAALCRECDIQVHDANKLAGKHHRVPLFRPPTRTSCDICQDKTAYFFCLEDRALLCHNCDMSIHKLTASTSNHRRFLVTGVAASLHTLSGQAPATSPGTPPPKSSHAVPNSNSHSRASKSTKRREHRDHAAASDARRHCQSSPQTSTSTSTTSTATVITGSNTDNSKSCQVPGVRKPAAVVTTLPVAPPPPPPPPPPPGDGSRKTSIFEFLTEAVPGWKCDELLNLPDSSSLASSYTFDPKIDANFAWPSANVSRDQIYFRSVPQMDKLPAGFNATKVVGDPAALKLKTKPGIFLLPEPDDAFLVPDLGLHSAPELPPAVKRRRTYSELDNIFLSR
ncbi:hypothetical protein SELMODRAFT_444777 [Selaginella moellendorffii]|uniref:B box-type domain-containing protein n=2 Tax=Selaginella moellendorffii TaxID=88036 RepID=D8SCW9_SELML|nr:B-box zinc finger protein 20 [Selaginella moellendorffii]XP_024541776.1 B-box zinc finger protein 20 [Selaginella moellendorffii]XP_024541777.1 B-box zinc finger protein 20 [Selaginella moellendorffii]EFJ17928.1 hypothetical protein SELMODRAFT_444777 [Selaginella moellendorffii]|eukprot:XP_002981227.1 B-box zinc finger protein 20 [Selaginella moellendorffii]